MKKECLYDAVKMMYLINELAKKSENGIIPFKSRYQAYGPIYFDENTRELENTQISQTDSIYNSTLYCGCLQYQITVKYYSDGDDYYDETGDDWYQTNESLSPAEIEMYKAIEKTPYLELHPVGSDECLYIYNGNVYVDYLDIVNEITDDACEAFE